MNGAKNNRAVISAAAGAKSRVIVMVSILRMRTNGSFADVSLR
jgi:hypothetical protein